MAQLAIKGHSTRGKEVIEILEMLGGKNKYHFRGDEDEWFVLNGNIQRSDRLFTEKGFTLEEFLEKFPYKVGDKVQHKGATSCVSVFEVEKMRWVDYHVEYTIKRLWYNNCHSVVTTEDLQPYKEETMDKAVFDANAQCCDIMNHLIKKETMEENLEQITLDIPDGYEFFGIDDNNKVVLTKKQPPKYPKTHVECCEILYPNENFQTVAQPIKGHNGKKLFALQKLLVCRDAYWKIVGEQMKLGKPWEPDYTDDNIKYNITIHRNKLDFNCTIERNYVLIFPTEEMRDAFYENFKELIEECKELL